MRKNERFTFFGNLPVLHVNLAQALFSPRAIALVGASGDAAKDTARPLRFLRKHGYTGRIVPINAKRSEVLGERAWPSLTEAPGEIDHAFVMTSGESVEQALEEGFSFVAMARALLREPDLVSKMAAGNSGASLCIHCNKCMPTIYSGTRCVLVDPPPR